MKCAQVISLSTLLVLCAFQWSSAAPPSDITVEFGINMYKEIYSKNTGRNVFFSPLSIKTAFAMVHLGAGGNTRTQLKNVLKFNSSKTDEENYKDIKTVIEILLKTKNVHLAHRVFGSKKFTYSDVYQKHSQNYFQQTVQSVDFNQAEDSRKLINDWVLKQTGGKIKEFLLQGSITKSTVLEIIDAIHVVAPWKCPFNIKDTKPGTFTTSKDEEIELDMMHLRPTLLNYGVSKTLDCEIVELTFARGELSMFFVLPRGKLETVQNKLTAKALTEAYKSLKKTPVELHLPKFETDQRINVKNYLKSQGVIDLYDVKKSNLSGMLTKGGLGLYATETTHKTFWEINEYGLNVGLDITKPTDCPPVKDKPIVIKFNKPFLVLIKDMTANVALLCGHVLDKPTTGDVLD